MTVVETPEVRDRWRADLDLWQQRRARTRALREQLAQARAAGVALRQQRRTARANPAGGHP